MGPECSPQGLRLLFVKFAESVSGTRTELISLSDAMQRANHWIAQISAQTTLGGPRRSNYCDPPHQRSEGDAIR